MRTERRRIKGKKLLPINKDCRHCKKNDHRTPHPNCPEEEYFFNKKYRGWHPRYACKIVGCSYKEHMSFGQTKGGPILTDLSELDDSS